jgi:hypothetical protein
MVTLINWDGTGLAQLTTGLCTDVWLDTKTDQEYIYVRKTQSATNGPLVRYCIDDLTDSQVVWDRTAVGHDDLGSWFTVSGDGKVAGDDFPHPKMGFALLPNVTWKQLDGLTHCRPSLAPDNSYVMWGLHTNHRWAPVCGLIDGYRGELDLHSAPGIKGWEVVHPKWSNDADFVTVTGPYDDRSGGTCVSDDCGNHLNDGSYAMNLYIGKLNPERTEVIGWVQITADNIADFFGDAWIDPGVVSSATPTILTQPQVRTVFAGNPVTLWVTAAGYPHPDYQWKKDGVNINGATFAMYIDSSAALTDSGVYTVEVSNSVSSVVSSPAKLTVKTAAANSLVLHYSFETGRALDLAGSNDANFAGSGGLAATADAAAGTKALVFDGDDYLRATCPPVLTDLCPYSYALWIKPGTVGGPLLSKTYTTTFFWGRELSVDPDGAVRMVYGKRTTSTYSKSVAGVVTSGAWQHVVVTQASTSAPPKIYCNGAEVQYESTAVGSGSLQGDGELNLYIGGRVYLGGAYFNGSMDDVRVYNYALSTGEITALYGSTGMARPSAPRKVAGAWQIQSPLTVTALAAWTKQLKGIQARCLLYTADGHGPLTVAPTEAGVYIYRIFHQGLEYCGRVVVVR